MRFSKKKKQLPEDYKNWTVVSQSLKVIPTKNKNEFITWTRCPECRTWKDFVEVKLMDPVNPVVRSKCDYCSTSFGLKLPIKLKINVGGDERE